MRAIDYLTAAGTAIAVAVIILYIIHRTTEPKDDDDR